MSTAEAISAGMRPPANTVTSTTGTKSLEKWEEMMLKCENLSEDAVRILNELARDIWVKDKNLIRLSSPISVCGDLHGQFFDLLELFRVGGYVPYTSYLFLGDYVDRGYYSVETFMYLVLKKVMYPDRIHLIRGNHESRSISRNYGFYEECIRRQTVAAWRMCCTSFDYLPVTAIIDDTIFCTHGGLSPSLPAVDNIDEFDRMVEVPDYGPMCDLLWSDPDSIEGWGVNSRGAGYVFGAHVTEEFLRVNNLSFIARAHQLVMEGYNYWFNNKLATVWSAPNYTYHAGNVASIMQISGLQEHTFRLFSEAPAGERKIPAMCASVPDYFL
ncbi:Metallo-dependent phosphatase [Carpediemonas membranifera]|uniref:Serine/threonine-protein phosphatase n=1 Tax=Carpediemonas membranifera TaxID=201153 RepID=A0A8J6DZX5_9EUKA|nr:Metallo-dependent phosphatase [Carpediemonas membranifera]|eukprot:KAG9391031.1 Metallo-dependent phosphatase [Carpediemonas membranifera]